MILDSMILDSWKLGFRFVSLAVVSWTVVDGGPVPAADAPPYFKRLIEEGNVKLEFYDPEKTPRKHLGHTQFELHVRHRSSFQFGWTVERGAKKLTIRTTISDLVPSLSHTITLPERLDSDRLWNSRLVKHEFDHVAISCDPRVMMLVKCLYDGVNTIDRTIEPNTAIDNRLIESIINEQVTTRLKATIEAIKANQDLLDKVTRGGVRAIGDRKKFFGSLYTEPNLKEIGFPYLDEVGDLPRSKPYTTAKLPYQID